MDKKVEIAAVSDEESVILFNALGINTNVVKNASEAEKKIFELASRNCKIIYVSENLYTSIPETIERYQQSPFPILMPLPIGEISLNIGRKKIKENVEKAIGIDIF